MKASEYLSQQAELEQAAKAKQAAPVPLPVGEQIAILVVATVLAGGVLVLLGTVPVSIGGLVLILFILILIVVSKEGEGG